jgi:hypothetical protein
MMATRVNGPSIWRSQKSTTPTQLNSSREYCFGVPTPSLGRRKVGKRVVIFPKPTQLSSIMAHSLHPNRVSKPALFVYFLTLHA